ncbi:hypothetical protein D3C83_22570 [compost metagenome]
MGSGGKIAGANMVGHREQRAQSPQYGQFNAIPGSEHQRERCDHDSPDGLQQRHVRVRENDARRNAHYRMQRSAAIGIAPGPLNCE